MPSLDTWIHIAELIIVVVVVPSLKSLVKVLFTLQQAVTILTQNVSGQSTSFTAHVMEDHRQFQAQGDRLNRVDGNVREILGLLQIRRRRDDTLAGDHDEG